MSGEDLEAEIAVLRARFTELEERVRLSTAADRFIAGDYEIRSGDCVRFSDGFATRVGIDSESGKWTYRDRNGSCIEPFRTPPEYGIERLYTIAEVAEIVAKERLRAR